MENTLFKALRFSFQNVFVSGKLILLVKLIKVEAAQIMGERIIFPIYFEEKARYSVLCRCSL